MRIFLYKVKIIRNIYYINITVTFAIPVIFFYVIIIENARPIMKVNFLLFIFFLFNLFIVDFILTFFLLVFEKTLFEKKFYIFEISFKLKFIKWDAEKLKTF